MLYFCYDEPCGKENTVAECLRFFSENSSVVLCPLFSVEIAQPQTNYYLGKEGRKALLRNSFLITVYRHASL